MSQKNSGFNELKVSVKDLKIGMHVSRLDKSWGESSFLFQGFLINNEKLIRQLKKECDHVYIDSDKLPNKGAVSVKRKSLFNLSNFFGKKNDNKAIKVSRKKTNDVIDIIKHKVLIENITPPERMVSFDKEMSNAKLAHLKISSLTKDIADTIRQGETIDMVAAKYAVSDCMQSLLRTPDALLLINRLKTKRYNTWQHGVNVSVLAMSLGRYLNINDEELIILGLCGMFHDIGELMISKKKLQEAGDKKEFLQSHTTLGRDILLKSMGQLSEVTAEVAYCHHERLNGTGFPRGIRAGQISMYSQIIGMIDLYDTLITDNSSKKGLTHYDAMSVLLKQAGHCFDETLVNSFNKCIGVYPIGALVEMTNGELARVVEENLTQRLRPKVMVMTTEDKKKCHKKVVDLYETKETPDGKLYAIKAIVRADNYDIAL